MPQKCTTLRGMILTGNSRIGSQRTRCHPPNPVDAHFCGMNAALRLSRLV